MARLAEIIPFAARLALECIGNSDALYHNVEHTMLVTLAGHKIFIGRALLKRLTPADYANFIVACLTHDIGYVRGIIKGDDNEGYVIDGTGRKVTLPRGASDAALAPYHVERSKLFVLDRLAEVEELDSERIARAIGYTQFPYRSPADEGEIDEDGSLLRAADLIGQLGDPHYLRKSNALYHEFEETGLNKQFGYDTPADLYDKYPQFYWRSVFRTLVSESVTLTSLPAGVSGLPASIAMCFVRSVICTCQGRSPKCGLSADLTGIRATPGHRRGEVTLRGSFMVLSWSCRR